MQFTCIIKIIILNTLLSGIENIYIYIYIYRERGVAKIPKDCLMGYSPKERLVQIMFVSVKIGRCSSWALMHVCTSTGR